MTATTKNATPAPAHPCCVTIPSSSADSKASRQARIARGVSAGGRFTVTSRVEPGLQLQARERAAQQVTRDKYGFPVVACTRCSGRGRFSHNDVDADRCYGCGGNGTVLAPEVAREVVAEFSAAQRAAARPKVRDIKAGDIVSKPYQRLEDASFRRVVRVLVAPQKPTRFEGRGDKKRAVAFAAAIDYEDGTRDLVTTDFVYARRGAEVDPAPFVARATSRRGNGQTVRRRSA